MVTSIKIYKREVGQTLANRCPRSISQANRYYSRIGFEK